jgi:hypothetical protein
MKSKGCGERSIAIERKLCGMGDGWGSFSKPHHLLIWWFVRHLVYVGAAALLVIYVPSSLNALVAFFMVVHLYKIIRYGFYYVYDQRMKNEGPKSNRKKVERECKIPQEIAIDLGGESAVPYPVERN